MSKASIFLGLAAVVSLATFFVLPTWWLPPAYDYAVETLPASVEPVIPELPPEPPVTHLPTPEPLKAIYMTSWVAGTKHLRDNLVKIIDETEVNALLIDIKDYTGQNALTDGRMPDIKDFIRELHDKNIYVLGRIAVFQDPLLVKERPELAARRKSDGEVWRDRKGISWLDAGAKEVWDYVAEIGREAYALGFDELNFDYIRFPSDGDMANITYPFSSSTEKARRNTMRHFFAYLDESLADLPVPTSADLFGLTTSAKDDLGIGQVLEDAAPHFDYLAPMIYPSHFASGYQGLENPAAHPYEVIKHSLDEATKKLLAASSSPAKLRPWLQDFDLGATYDAEMVRAQIKATYDAGVNSWMLWDPSNKYTRGALDAE